MQQLGEICKGCEEYRKAVGDKPVRLKSLPGNTMNHGKLVAACEYCDGEYVFTFGGSDGDTAGSA
jgi:hypothetical protein